MTSKRPLGWRWCGRQTLGDDDDDDGRLTRTDVDDDVDMTTQLERLWSTDTQSVGWAFDTNRP